MFRLPARHLLIVVCILGLDVDRICLAGMPGLLPSGWTKDHTPAWSYDSTPGYDWSADPRWQAISFFVAGVLLSAWSVQRLWKVLRKDFEWLPDLSYGRSLSLVVLWGLAFILVLTMISGARELMTPGAWKQQGWTYKLAQSGQSEPNPHDGRVRRRRALEQIRTSLWQFAAMHQGTFPEEPGSLDPELWAIPDWPGMLFLYVPGRKAEANGQLLVYEPELDGDERQVLLTNGMIGTMRTIEIQQALSNQEKP